MGEEIQEILMGHATTAAKEAIKIEVLGACK